MKKFTWLLLASLSFNSFAYTIVDALHEQPEFSLSFRDPASESDKHCIVNEQSEIFGNSCYTSQELCSKRLEFWKDLPGVKDSACVKM